jgi:hypothetical protein
VSGAEWLLRRVPDGNPAYFDPLQPAQPLQRIAFKPSPEDLDGISLFREMFVSPPVLSMTGRKPPYCVVRLRVRDVERIGLKVQPAPDDEQPAGHVVLPGLRHAEKPSSKEKEQSKTYQLLLRDAVHLPSALVPRQGG